MKLIYVDIDNTICTYSSVEESTDYYKAIPIKEHIQKINSLYQQGNKIVYYTARASVYKDKKQEYLELTKKQLHSWGALYHELSVGEKPPYDLMICDKTKRIEEI